MKKQYERSQTSLERAVNSEGVNFGVVITIVVAACIILDMVGIQ